MADRRPKVECLHVSASVRNVIDRTLRAVAAVADE